MASLQIFSSLRNSMMVVLVLGALTILFVMYYRSFPSPKCHPPPVHWTRQTNLRDQSVFNRSVLLLWFWPEDVRFDLQVCRMFYNIDHCHLTDDRSLQSKAQGVLIFHSSINDDLSNLPTSRTRLQRWIWFNMDSPTNTRRIAGIQGLFNLTMTYRRDADIEIRWKVNARKNSDKDFVLPKKERLLCWIVDSNDLHTKSGERYTFFIELVKHIKVDLFDKASDDLKGDNYFLTISYCKFYLSFENSIHRDYITETFTGPLAVGTVPIALGPPRRNYEKFAPSASFIHVNDFPDAGALAEFLLKLDNDDKAYKAFFEWWKFYTVKRHFTEAKYEFAHAICQACRFVDRNKDFRVVPDLYKWFLE